MSKEGVRFNISNITVTGEWNEETRVLFINDLGGEATVTGKVMGKEIDVQGEIGAAADSTIVFRVKSIGKIPPFLNELILKGMVWFNKKLKEAVTVTKDTISLNADKLIPESSGIKMMVQPETIEKPEALERNWREKVLDWTEKNAGSLSKEVVDYILTIPDMLGLIKRLAMDSRIPGRLKLKIALCITYVVSPIDLIPEAVLGPLGLADDAFVLFGLIRELANEIPEAIIREHWHGRSDMLEVIIAGQGLAKLVTVIPGGVQKKLLGLFGGKEEAAAGKSK